MLQVGKQYAYINKEYVQPMKTGFFLGTIKKPIPSQSYHDDRDIGLYWVFASKPTKQLISKHNEYVLDSSLGEVFQLESIGDFRAMANNEFKATKAP